MRSDVKSNLQPAMEGTEMAWICMVSVVQPKEKDDFQLEVLRACQQLGSSIGHGVLGHERIRIDIWAARVYSKDFRFRISLLLAFSGWFSFW